uniref:Uncharacterized protein n=1 Tax=Oryza glaberrima TaxID=4538 RepID=I1PPQ8_ORYGL
MEALWLPFPVLQHVLFYEAAGLTPFDSVVDSLRSSLGATLATFAPLAGKLVHLEDTGDVAIACSASDAVRFVEAECDADVRRVAGDEAHDLRTFEQLVPELDMSKLPTSVLAVQATCLQGGLAVGVTLHHGVADEKSFWTFVEAWASACRCRGEAPAATPCFDRSVIKWPGGEEIARSVLRVRAGLACRGTQAFHPPDIHRGRAATRTPKATAKSTAKPCIGLHPASSPSSRWPGHSSPDARPPPRTRTPAATCSFSSSPTSASASTTHPSTRDTTSALV